MLGSDRLATAMLVLGGAALVGMVLGTWELVLYPSLLLVGALLAMSLAGRRSLVAVGLPVGVGAALVAMFATLHLMGVDDPSGTGSFLGWDPMTAFYLFVIGPAFLLLGLLYALTERPGSSEEAAR